MRHAAVFLVGASARLTLAPLVLFCLYGCASPSARRGEQVTVSVSAANYSRLSDEELYSALHAPIATPPRAPATHQPAAIHRYLLTPGEVYPNDVPMDVVYHEVALVLEKRGYFDAAFETNAGRALPVIDYFLRIHYGRRLWLNPTVRGDGVTWGNDGLVSNRYKSGLISDWSRDLREGLSPEDTLATRSFLSSLSGGFGMGSGGGKKADTSGALAMEQANMGIAGPMVEKLGEIASSDFYLVVIEAFRSDDVERMDKRAPCVWAVFIAVPAEGGQKFSSVLRGMLQAATPYFEETTHGLQVQDVPAGRVLLGTPEGAP